MITLEDDDDDKMNIGEKIYIGVIPQTLQEEMMATMR